MCIIRTGFRSYTRRSFHCILHSFALCQLNKRQRTKDHHNKAVVFINYLFCLLYYEKRLVLKMNSCTAKNTCLFSSTEMSVLSYKILSNIGWQKVEIVFKRT